MLHRDRLLGLGLLLFCALGWFWIVPVYVEGETAQLYPRCMLVFISLPSIGLCMRPRPLSAGKNTATDTPAEHSARIRATLKMIALMGCYLVYLLLIPRVGFFACSIVAAIFFLWFLGVRRVRSLVFVPAVILLCVHLVIERGLRFDLPNGLLF